ncbi:orotate phosphoribosyltransferase [Fulvivirgaceae bacterium LMO-SS25]
MQILDKEIAEKVAALLLDAKAIKLSPDKPFTWASGWKSPIYCDNRVALSYPTTRSYIKEQLARAIRKHFVDVDLIAGVATAGIPQGALVADLLELPFAYVRSKPKGHGMENLIEGKVTAGQKVVIVEDLISTGGSSLKAAEALVQADCTVLGMVAIFTYGFAMAEDNFKKQNIELVVLSDYSHLLEKAVKDKIIKESELELLNNWRKKPSEWGQ